MNRMIILILSIIFLSIGFLCLGICKKETDSKKQFIWNGLFIFASGACISGGVYVVLHKMGYVTGYREVLVQSTVDWFVLMLYIAGILGGALGVGLFIAICRNWGIRKYLFSLNKCNWYSVLTCLAGMFLFFIGANLYLIYAKNSVVINEVCSDNFSILQDSYGNYSDYIELYNPSNTEVSLAGYVLSDDESNLGKYTLGDISIGPKEYLIIFLNGNTESGIKENLQAPFRLNSKGEQVYLFNNSGELIDVVSVPLMDYDCSFARLADGIYGTTQCTPGRDNFSDEESISISVSVRSGFYEEPFYLELTSERNCKIYYTVDGSVPDESDTLYQKPILIEDRSKEEDIYSDITGISNIHEYSGYEGNVDKANVVRAVAYFDNGEISPVLTQVYYVGFDNKYGYEGMPCISIVIEPDDMFGNERGIYMLGDTYEQYLSNGGDPVFEFAEANYNQRGNQWEREIYFSYYNEEHEMEFEQECGIRIQASSKRSNIQKNFNIICRNKYGNACFEKNFFNDDYKISNVILRSSMYSFYDAIPYELVKEKSIGLEYTKPCIVFINGEFWGLYVLQEKYVPSYFEEHFSVEADNLVLLKNGELKEGKNEDIIEYKELLNFVKENDLSIESNYEYVCEQIDVQNYIEYICTQTYICNMDYCENKNIYMWKAREQGDGELEDGKWRWLLYDIDFSAGSENRNTYTVNSFSEPMPWCKPATLIEGTLFKELVKNVTFREQFTRTFIDMANSNFNSELVLPLIESYEEKLKEAYVASVRRFSDGNYSEKDFSLQKMKDFYANRYPYIIGYLAEEVK